MTASNKTKARVTLTFQADGAFHYSAFRIGEVVPFLQGKIKTESKKQAASFAWMRVKTEIKGARPYVAGAAPCN